MNHNSDFVENDDDNEESSNDELDNDSDRELQDLFKKGLLSDGLQRELPAPKQYVNNTMALKQKLAEIKLNLPWVERMDVTISNEAIKEACKDASSEDNDISFENKDSSLVDDDFKREYYFLHQAKLAVCKAIPKLQALSIPIWRPSDYFAEMVKNDAHMKKVKEKLLAKQQILEKSIKAKKLRELKKYGKQIQQTVASERQKEKKELGKAVKKFRKTGGANKADLEELLDNNPVQTKKKTNIGGEKLKKRVIGKRRQFKNKKFGFGGQKKRSKYNTAASSADMSGYGTFKHLSMKATRQKTSDRNDRSMFAKSNKNKSKNRTRRKQQRPGKERRKKMKKK